MSDDRPVAVEHHEVVVVNHSSDRKFPREFRESPGSDELKSLLGEGYGTYERINPVTDEERQYLEELLRRPDFQAAIAKMKYTGTDWMQVLQNAHDPETVIVGMVEFAARDGKCVVDVVEA